MRAVARRSGRLGVVDRLSSELLGFTPDARVLIVNCDDFGMHDAVNAAVLESIENGIASSGSLMVPCPAASNAMRLLRERPHIPFGIHLALIRDSPEYRWGPIAAKPTSPARAAATQARALRSEDSRSASTLAVPRRSTAVNVEVARRNGLMLGQMKYGVMRARRGSIQPTGRTTRAWQR
jgi:YdjC-like protein